MSKMYLISLPFVLFLGCKGNREKITGKEETKTVNLDNERRAVSEVLMNFNKYYSAKNMNELKKLFGNSVHFFWN